MYTVETQGADGNEKTVHTGNDLAEAQRAFDVCRLEVGDNGGVWLCNGDDVIDEYSSFKKTEEQE